ncbi:acyl-CoA dehydrogenase family protein [Amycolatopsis sp. NPDC004625]|uniref:acyl-CoA dehydrogenase family protein n=1 Tax=Amycolatopsis sp. NPDC004625 TaxID=3154670 RepID=UPI0033A3E049
MSVSTERRIREAIGEFADRNLDTGLLLRLDRDDECPEDLVRRMRGDDLGIHLLFVPEAYGGMGAGSLDVCRVYERLAGIDLGALKTVAVPVAEDGRAAGYRITGRKQWISNGECGRRIPSSSGACCGGSGSRSAAARERAVREDRPSSPGCSVRRGCGAAERGPAAAWAVRRGRTVSAGRRPTRAGSAPRPRFSSFAILRRDSPPFGGFAARAELSA